MLQTTRATRGMLSAPHHLAAQAGSEVLREGGNAIEAMIAAASTINIAYPHMSGLGGDNFWLIHAPGEKVLGIDACGAAAGLADTGFYHQLGHQQLPSRGPLAALTCAGAVSGWREALSISRQWGGTLPLGRLFEDALHYAKEGIAVTRTLAENSRAKLPELATIPGFAETYLDKALPLKEGALLRQPRQAAVLEQLARAGLEDFYHGDLARSMAADLERLGSPLRLSDFQNHRALRVTPLEIQAAGHLIYNLPPPTQGLASLILLGVYARLKVPEADTFAYVHALVEATKCAFKIRDAHITDPHYMQSDPGQYLESVILDEMARSIDPQSAAPWPAPPGRGDTVWLGAVDARGRAVSFIQSIYWEFGSGTVLEESGITWQNRGTSFSLDATHLNALKPRRRPFHTIQPALARLSNGSVMAYGAMGGEGQPQTQAMVFSRAVLHGQGLQEAVTAPRWLLGRTWGSDSTSLRIENRFDPALMESLRNAGHPVEVVGPYEEIMGHAGALIRRPDGVIEGAADPRGDGQAAGF